jgi:hypothetical protein
MIESSLPGGYICSVAIWVGSALEGEVRIEGW